MQKIFGLLFFGVTLFLPLAFSAVSTRPFYVEASSSTAAYQLFVVNGKDWNDSIATIKALGAEPFVPWDKDSVHLSTARLSSHQKSYNLNIVKPDANSSFLNYNTRQAHNFWPSSFDPTGYNWGPIIVEVYGINDEWGVDSPLEKNMEILAKAPLSVKLAPLSLNIGNKKYQAPHGSPVCGVVYPYPGEVVCDDLLIKRAQTKVENNLTITPTYNVSPSINRHQEAFSETCRFYVNFDQITEPVYEETRQRGNSFCSLKVTEDYVQISFHVYQNNPQKLIFSYYNKFNHVAP